MNMCIYRFLNNEYFQFKYLLIHINMSMLIYLARCDLMPFCCVMVCYVWCNNPDTLATKTSINWFSLVLQLQSTSSKITANLASLLLLHDADKLMFPPKQQLFTSARKLSDHRKGVRHEPPVPATLGKDSARTFCCNSVARSHSVCSALSTAKNLAGKSPYWLLPAAPKTKTKRRRREDSSITSALQHHLPRTAMFSRFAFRLVSL